MVRVRHIFGLLSAVSLFALFSAASMCAESSEYRVIKKIKIGGEGGWDYITVDDTRRRLFIPRGTHVAVVDIDSGNPAGDIPDTPGVHGVALAQNLNRGFTSNGKANTSTIFNLQTLETLSQVKTGDNPDTIIYDPFTKNVFAFNGGSKDATVFRAATGKVVGTIPLGGKPEAAISDGRGKLYVNIEDTGEIAEIDGSTLAVTRRFSLNPGEKPTGIAMDYAHQHIFSVCRNKMMVVVDITTGAVVATVPIGDGADGAGFDPDAGLAFSSNGSGTLTVVSYSTSTGKFNIAATVTTQRSARTMAIDPKTHNIYLPCAQMESLPPAAAGTKQRPSAVKGSFAVLVVGK